MSAFTNEVVGPLTDTELRATPVPVTGPLTDTELRATPVPVSGTVSVNEPVSVDDNGGSITVDGNVGVTGTVTVVQPTGTNLHVTVDGTVSTTVGGAPSATTTQFTSTGSNQMLLASNASRKKVIFFFNSGIWDIKLGVTASATSRLMRISSSNYYLEIEGYSGQIDAICTTSGKLVDVTEIA